MAPMEQIRLKPSTARNAVVKVAGTVIGYRLEIGIVRMLRMKLTTPPMTKRIADRSTKPCFNGEVELIFLTS
jgi:hypothetical protein